jgi:hypothetical protein
MDRCTRKEWTETKQNEQGCIDQYHLGLTGASSDVLTFVAPGRYGVKYTHGTMHHTVSAYQQLTEEKLDGQQRQQKNRFAFFIYNYCSCFCLVPAREKQTELDGREEVVHVAQLVVDHEGQHPHLGGPALVELHGALLQLGLLIERVPAEIDVVVAEVAWFRLRSGSEREKG